MTSIDIVLPVYNEESMLSKSLETLRAFLVANTISDYEIVIADNASTDNTLAVAKQLALKSHHVTWIHLDQKGRGRALRKAWLESTADVMCYMDIDLSTELTALSKMLEAFKNGCDVVYGSRLSKNSTVQRTFEREILSRGYNLLVKLFLRTTFSDAQCGFKGITRKAAHELIPLIEDNNWFFDTELLVLAERKGYMLCEIPVLWRDDGTRQSKVKIAGTCWDYIKNIKRLRSMV